MRRAALTLAVIAILGLAAGTALAGHGNRGYGGGRYGCYGTYGGYQSYGYYQRSRSYGYDSNSFPNAVRRVQGKYSTYRYSTHPRSYDKSVPYRYQYWGW